MTDRILYLGDTNLSGAAAYLAGLMTDWGSSFDYLPSDAPIDARRLDTPFALFVLSDYPAAQMSDDAQAKLVEQVAAGAGLLMIGGWESFHGESGHWNGARVGDALPVEISADDDRMNCDHPVLVSRVTDHPTIADLPWDDRPPIIGGFNRVTAKSDATVVLQAQHFRVERQPIQSQGDQFAFHPQGSDPLLVVGQHRQGRIAALATDVAPHWVGPLIDWGDDRVTGQAADSWKVEVGSHYAQFLRQLLTWVGHL